MLRRGAGADRARRMLPRATIVAALVTRRIGVGGPRLESGGLRGRGRAGPIRARDPQSFRAAMA